MPPSGTIGLYPKFRADDLDGNPLEGGKLYSYLAGTSTPQALYADAELTTALSNPLVLDASGEALFYYGPSTYKLALHDAQDVPQWVIDPVSGTGGGAGAAGIGLGSNTVALRPSAGAAQAVVAVFPASVLALGLTVWVSETLGTSQGLAAVGIGTSQQPDAWGVLTQLTAATTTTAGVFLGYSGQPIPADGTVQLTAYDGLFDGTGQVYLTGHFATFHPAQVLGMSWTPPGPPAPDAPAPPLYATEISAGSIELATQAELTLGTDALRAVTPLTLATTLSAGTHLPPASETTRGIVELASAGEVLSGIAPLLAVTPAGLSARLASETATGLVELATTTETTTGTDPTRAVTPAGLSAKVANGTALSVVRYGASGQTLEPGSATVVIDASGRLGVGQATPLTPLHVVGEIRTEGFQRVWREASVALIQAEAIGDSAASHYGHVQLGHSGGTLAGRTAIATAARLGTVSFSGHTGSALATGAQVDTFSEEPFTAGTLGTRLSLLTAQLGTATLTERLRLDSQGRIGLHTTLSATLGVGSYQPLTVKGSTLTVGQSSVQERAMTLLESAWATSTDASRKARLTLSVYDATAAREGLRIETSGTAAMLSFYGAAAVAKPTVTGSRGGNAALASALSALASLGLVTDSSTA